MHDAIVRFMERDAHSVLPHVDRFEFDTYFRAFVVRLLSVLAENSFAVAHGIIDHYAHQESIRNGTPLRNVYDGMTQWEKLRLPLPDVIDDVRLCNMLEEEEILTVHDLLECTEAELLAIPMLGAKSLDTIFAALGRLGFHRMED